MALVVADRVQETTTTTGTGTYSLAGAKDGFQSFAAVGNSNTTYYACTDGTDYEVGIGTYTLSGTTLARTTIIESSNSDAAVNWGAGEKDIFVTLPASKAVIEDASNNVAIGNNITVGGTVDGVDIAARDAVLTSTTTTANGALQRTGGTVTGTVTYQSTINFLDNKEIRMGSGNDFRLQHNGVNSYIDNYQNDLYIRNHLDDKDVYIQSDDGVGGLANYFVADGSTGEVQLYHYGSEKLATQSGGINVTGTVTDDGAVHDGDVTFTGASYNVVWDKSDNALEFAENAKATFGAGDLQIYHDGTNSYIADVGTGGLYFRASSYAFNNAANTETITFAQEDGAVTLYYDGSAKLATTSTGVDVTGNITVSGTVDGRDVATDGTKLDGIEAGANVGPSLAVAIALG